MHSTLSTEVGDSKKRRGRGSVCELHLCLRELLHCMTWLVWRRRASCRCRPVCPWPQLPWWKSCTCAGRCWGSRWRGSAGRSASPAAAPRWRSGSGGPCRSWASCWSKCQHHLYGDAHRIWWIYTHTHTHKTHNQAWVTAGLLSKNKGCESNWVNSQVKEGKLTEINSYHPRKKAKERVAWIHIRNHNT